MITNKKATLFSFILLSSSLVFSSEQPILSPNSKQFGLGLVHGAINGAIRAGISAAQGSSNTSEKTNAAKKTKLSIDQSTLLLIDGATLYGFHEFSSPVTNDETIIHGIGQMIAQPITQYLLTGREELDISFNMANLHLLCGLLFKLTPRISIKAER